MDATKPYKFIGFGAMHARVNKHPGLHEARVYPNSVQPTSGVAGTPGGLATMVSEALRDSVPQSGPAKSMVF